MTRQAKVSEAGAGIFLTPSQLRELGYNPETTDAVEYAVTDGAISLSKPERQVTGD